MKHLMNILIGTQTEIQTNTKHKEQTFVATQCNLLDTPPLEFLKPSDDVFVNEAESEETDHDTSFCLSQEDSSTE